MTPQATHMNPIYTLGRRGGGEGTGPKTLGLRSRTPFGPRCPYWPSRRVNKGPWGSREASGLGPRESWPPWPPHSAAAYAYLYNSKNCLAVRGRTGRLSHRRERSRQLLGRLRRGQLLGRLRRGLFRVVLPAAGSIPSRLRRGLILVLPGFPLFFPGWLTTGASLSRRGEPPRYFGVDGCPGLSMFFSENI